VKPHAVAHAHWFAHVNGVNPPREMRGWLTDTGSLTRKRVGDGGHFPVKRLRQGRALCLADEFALVDLSRRSRVQEREVLLLSDERPLVYAHTIVPLNATAADWPFFGTLGERSLGTTLFGDPRVRRGALHYARLHARHPLARRASAALGGAAFAAPLFARRCVYQRRHGKLLVTELFLPALAELHC